MGSQLALELVPESDEEAGGSPPPLALTHQQPAADDDGGLISEDEPAWMPPPQQHWQDASGGGALRQLNALLPLGTQTQQLQAAGGKVFSRSIAPKLASRRSNTTTSNRRTAAEFRVLRTSAAVEAASTAAACAAAQEAELSAALPGTRKEQEPSAAPPLDENGVGGQEKRQQQQQVQRCAPAGRRPTGTSGASFMNRKVLLRPISQTEELRQKLQDGPSNAAMSAAADVDEAVEGKVPEANAAVGGTKAQATVPHRHPAQQQQHQQRPCAAQAGPGVIPGAPAPPAHSLVRTAAPAAAAPAATFHRTADGLNIVHLNRQAGGSQAAADGCGKAKGRNESVNSGWGNNFVRIDLKKGRGSTKYGTKYSSKRRKGGRGGRGGSRWQVPRMRQVGDGADYLEGWQGSRMRCFKCGATGHFAKECTAEQQAQADMGALHSGSSSDEEGGQEQLGGGAGGSVSRAARSAVLAVPPSSQQTLQGPGRSTGGPGLVAAEAGGNAAGPPNGHGSSSQRAASAASLPLPVDTAARYTAVLANPSEAALTGVLQEVFGHPTFRGLQLATVQRLLAGESLLSIMPTGMGKSLCYQLPAALLPGLTLVVSPLIALMRDQAASVPPPLTAAVLSSRQTPAEALQVLADVAVGRIKILFVSPERLNNHHLLEALRSRMPLPLVVVDEAHCVAEWGHSFRPAYFRLGAALAGAVRAERILALTATATRATETAIRQVLRIPAEGVLRDAAVRQNLRLQVMRTAGGGSCQATRDRICGLFCGSGPLATVRSAIVYCPFKEDANQLARMLGARKVSARAYHAGKDHRERCAVEAEFAAGRVRVVVATVAFGMGINLAAVGAVVHASLPRSLEEYVQQIGRAGRDGSEARCVALLDDSDFVRLRSLAFSGVLDLAAVRAFLEAVFLPAAEGQKRGRQAAKTAAAPQHGKSAAAGSRAVGKCRGRKRKAAAQVPSDASSDEDEGEEQEVEEAAATCTTAEAAGASPRSSDREGAAGEQEGSPEVAEDAPPSRRRFGVLHLKELADKLDMREDSMESVLSYLEADERPCLRMLPTTALSVKVSFYTAAAEQLAPQYPVVKSVLEACPNPRNGSYSMHAAKLATAAQQAPGLVLRELQHMAAGSLIGFAASSKEGFAYEILHTPADLDSLAQRVHARLAAVLACQVSRLDVSYRALLSAVRAGQAVAGGAEEQQAAQEAELRKAVEQYFDQHEQPAAAKEQEQAAGADSSCNSAKFTGAAEAAFSAGAVACASEGSTASALLLDIAGLPLKSGEPALLQAARAVLRHNREQAGPELSARALARILHGVGGPAYPPDAWHKRMGPFWGSQANVDFAAVLKAAEIVVRGEA